MLRYLFIALSIGVSAYLFPQFFQNNADEIRQTANAARQSAQNGDGAAAFSTRATETKKPDIRISGTERIRADHSGHFVATFRINGRRMDAVIDTGATTIAMNRSAARDAGVSLGESDFRYTVRTANGETRAARVVLDTVELGSVRVRDVTAMVLDDRSLDIVLIGMSYLGALDSFSQSNGVLTLKR